MEGRRWGLILGVNHCGFSVDTPNLRYAEDDARDVHEILIDRAVGTLDPDDAELMVGGQVRWRAVKDWLRERALDSGPSDVLLVYFAGHALVPEWSRQSDAYLATADLDVAKIRSDPEAGLRMASLKRDVFEMFAGTSFLILDCCHAGAYIESDLRYVEAIGTYGPQIDRHSALLSCPKDAVARETDEYRHGVLTYNILRALRGEAADPDGRVSFAQMANFVSEQGIYPTPGQLVQMWGPTTVLTQPTASRPARKRPLTTLVGTAKVVACENPFDRCSSSILQLLGRVFQAESRVPRQRSSAIDKADRIRHAVDADAIAVVEFSETGHAVIDATARFDRHDLRALLEQSAVYTFPARPTSLGHLASDDDGRRVLCVPLTHDETRSLVLVVVNPANSLLDMGEPLAVVIQALWNLDVEDPLQAEVRVLTALRSKCGRLPPNLYERCFSLYQKLISSLVMVYQPVIHLDKRPRGVGIHSYEALARRSEADTRAPTSLLQIAKVWGDRFYIERDALLLRRALQGYADADAAAPWDTTKPVSINVAVRSLLSDAYLAVVRNALAEVSLDPRMVTLEISEQDPIRPAPGEVWPQEPLTHFQARLTRVARELEISFAVDDFGVGYSSLARLAELQLTQIKVDRALLHHPLALQELDLVARIARHRTDLGHSPVPRDVIVEGFDRDSPIALRDIYNLRIRHVQGYIVEDPASMSLRALNDETRERIAAKVRGEDDQRQSDAAAGDHPGAGSSVRRRP